MSIPTITQPRRRGRWLQEFGRPDGEVFGWHRGCPKTGRPFLGTYALCLDNEGHIVCYDCGAHDLAPTREEARRVRGIVTDQKGSEQ